VFELAKAEDAHSHRFRDTFAVSLLENGVSSVVILAGPNGAGKSTSSAFTGP
jgi:hypothetical protein